MARRRQQTAPTLPDRQLQAAEAWYEAMLQKAAARGFPVAPSDGVAAPCSIVELARTPFSCSGTLWTTFGRPRSGQGGCRMTRPPGLGRMSTAVLDRQLERMGADPGLSSGLMDRSF
jgi:hypothetical protein